MYAVVVKICIGLMLLASYPLAAHRQTFIADISHSQWVASGDIFSCSLSHNVPAYGDAIFYQRAGEPLEFYLLGRQSHFRSGKARLLTERPVWKGSAQARQIVTLAADQAKQPFTVNERTSRRMLSELHRGQQLVFSDAAWYGEVNPLRVAMVPTNFSVAYQQYQLCQNNLLPVNFDQIARSAINFPAGKGAQWLSAEVQLLEHLAIYIKADESVRQVILDGHTDSQGARSENLEVSRRRARMVADYLIAEGVPEDKLLLRWHGERYPLTTNRTAKGRAANRRVTVKLHKGKPIELKPVVPPTAEQQSAPPAKESPQG